MRLTSVAVAILLRRMGGGMGRAAWGGVPRVRRRVARLRGVIASLLRRRLLVVAVLRRRIGVLRRRVAVPWRRAVCAGVTRHDCGVFRVKQLISRGREGEEGGVFTGEVGKSSREKAAGSSVIRKKVWRGGNKHLDWGS